MKTKSSPKHKPEYDHCDYLRNLLPTNRLKKTTERAVAALNREGKDFDAIAFRGMSGALAAIPVALALGKPMLMVRKQTEDNHSGMLVEGDKAAKTYIIIDDFQSSGETARAIRTAIKGFAPEAECLGVMAVEYLHGNKKQVLEPIRE